MKAVHNQFQNVVTPSLISTSHFWEFWIKLGDEIRLSGGDGDRQNNHDIEDLALLRLYKGSVVTHILFIEMSIAIAPINLCFQVVPNNYELRIINYELY